MKTEVIARPPKIAKDGRVMSPSSLANLKPPYKPGTNGHGRVYPLKERLQHALDHPLKEPPPDAPHGDVIVYNTLKGAAELVPVAFRETWDRVEGKLQDNTPMGYQDNRQYNIVVADDETKAELRMLMAGRSKVRQNDNADT